MRASPRDPWRIIHEVLGDTGDTFPVMSSRRRGRAPVPDPRIPNLGYCPRGHYARLGDHCGACGTDIVPEDCDLRRTGSERSK